MTEPWHGTLNGYVNHECRCDLCRRANTLYSRKYRVRLQRGKVPRHVHGTNGGYTNYGCRCERCSRAHRQAAHQYYGRASQNS